MPEHGAGNISKRNNMKRVVLLSLIAIFYFLTGIFALFTVLAAFDKGTTVGVPITFAIITILSFRLAKIIANITPKKSSKTISETIKDLPQYSDIYLNTLKAYLRSIYLFSDDEVKEMTDFILANSPDVRDATAWGQTFYEKYLQPVQWKWVEFEEFKNIVYDMARNDESIKKSYLWWVFKADMQPSALMPLVLKKLKVGDKRQILTAANIPFEKGTKSADLSLLIEQRITPEQFRELVPEKFSEIEAERRSFLFKRLLQYIQAETINKYNVAVANSFGRQPILKPRTGYARTIVSRMKKVPAIPPQFPEDRFEKESNIS